MSKTNKKPKKYRVKIFMVKPFEFVDLSLGGLVRIRRCWLKTNLLSGIT